MRECRGEHTALAPLELKKSLALPKRALKGQISVRSRSLGGGVRTNTQISTA